MMSANVGFRDRIVRVVVGLAIISGFWLFPETQWKWAFLLGAIPALSGAVRWCPVYALLGWSTDDDGGGQAHA